MRPGADNFTREEEHYYNLSREVVLFPEKIHPEEWELINTIRELWYGRSQRMRGDLLLIYNVNLSCLNKQNVNFSRYAFCLEFPVPDVEVALRNRIEDVNLLTFRMVEGMWDFIGPVRFESKAYLKESLILTEDYAWHWLRVLVVVSLIRFDFPLHVEDRGCLASKADATDLVPVTKMYWGEIPDEFINIIMEKTGLEGDELQDEVDRIVFEVITPLNLGAWIEEQYRILAERQERMSRFRTYIMIAMACVVIIPAMIVAIQAATAAVATSTSMALSLGGKIVLFAQVFVGSLGLSFNAMLVAIRFQTFVGVHKIALLVSEEYRLIMSEVYGEIRKVSSALGYGPEFLLLLTQNSKKLIQDVGSTFGREWDLTEVQWLSTFQDYMGKFSGAAYKYRDNPEALLYDLGRWVEQPAVNTKGAFMAKLVETVDDTVEKTEEIVGNIVTVRDDIDKLVKDLPEDISKQIAEAIDPYVSKFDDFITDKYDPGMKAFNEVFDTIKAYQAELKTRADELIERLKKPADYLLEIDSLSDEDRLDQEIKIDDLSSRYYKRELTVRSEAMEPISAELGKIRDILTRPLELAFMGVEEVTAPMPIPIGEIDPSKTWFVGDF